MKRTLSVFFLFFTIHVQIKSQVLPKEDKGLNYRLVGFSFPRMQNANHYHIDIASGAYNTIDSFKKNIIKSLDCNTNKAIAEVPAFNKEYTWQVVYTVGHSKSVESDLHHFHTLLIPSIDTSHMRLRILKNAEQYADAYVFLDANRTLYDMKGHPVWFLPNTGELYHDNNDPRDLKITPQGTITFLLGEDGYEINYDGDILWKAPRSSEEHYHHDFTRLTNGHYMISAAEITNEYLSGSPSFNESGLIVVADNEINSSRNKESHPGWQFYKKEQYPKIVEYDTSGQIVWEYRSSAYFNKSDLYFRKNPNGTINTTVHDNGFYFDEKAKELYISLRDIGRIIKVKYPEGTTLNTYGELFTPGAIQNRGKGFFCGQHNCRVSEDGYLYLFNNNSCNWPLLPTIVMMQQPISANDSLKKVWEYQCTIDDMTEEEQKKLNFISSGAVRELPDHSMFVDMGGQYSKVFIVNKDKKILWSALPEKWSPENKRWEPFPQYRASIITNRQEMEHLIWHEETKSR